MNSTPDYERARQERAQKARERYVASLPPAPRDPRISTSRYGNERSAEEDARMSAHNAGLLTRKQKRALHAPQDNIKAWDQPLRDEFGDDVIDALHDQLPQPGVNV